MSTKQKVFVVLSPGFASSESDSTCLPMQQAFVRSLADLNPEVAVKVLSFHYPFVRRSYEWFNVTVSSFKGNNKGGLSGILLRRRVRRTLERIYRENNIVGLLSFWLGECASVGERFAARKGVRHYCWLMGQDAKPGNKYAGRLLMQGNNLIALSDILQGEFERNYRVRPAKVICPGIDNRTVSAVQRDIDLVGVGSLIPLKRLELFLEVVAAVKEQIPGIKAILAGDGPEYSKLKEMSDALGLDGTVHFAGTTSHDEVLTMMQRAKVLLHPSSYEGFSGVCQEALSCGAYVVSFCRAMNTEIRQWHIVDTKEEMIEKAMAILTDNAIKYESVPFQTMNCTAQQIMSCYL